MIRYSLKCADAHHFDSWFGSAEAFEALADTNRLQCPVCGTSDVHKALMAPRVTGGDSPDPAPAVTEDTLRPTSPAEQFLARLRRHVEKSSDYVGTSFATEARRMHLGEVPERAIHGEAKPDEARALIDDGIHILPLPFRTGTKSN